MLNRRGLSLPELLAVLVVLGVAAGAIIRVLTHHQRRFETLAHESVDRGRLREGATLLATALHDVAPAAGDLYPGEMTHASVGFRSVVGVFMRCDSLPAGSSTVDVAPISAHAGAATDSTGDSWSPAPPLAARGAGAAPTSPPAAGDSVLFYGTGRDLAADDDRWSRHMITAAGPIADCAGPSARAYRLTLSPPPLGPLDLHAPAIVYRRTRFTLYQAADNSWYLGQTECSAVRAPPCPALQPASGPYGPLGPAGDTTRGGLHITYLDSLGAVTGDPTLVAEVRIALRSPPRSGNPRAPATLSVNANLRNTRR